MKEPTQKIELPEYEPPTLPEFKEVCLPKVLPTFLPSVDVDQLLTIPNFGEVPKAELTFCQPSVIIGLD